MEDHVIARVRSLGIPYNAVQLDEIIAQHVPHHGFVVDWAHLVAAVILLFCCM